MNLKQYVRPGKKASDITPLFANAKAFRELVHRTATLFRDGHIDKVACIEGRGFILGSAVAYKLDVGLIPIRIKGKLQNETHQETFRDYSKEEKTLEIHADAVSNGEKVLIIDDWLETGESVKAAIRLVEKCGGEVIGVGVFIDDSTEDVKKSLKSYDYRYLEIVSPEDNF